MSVPFQFQGARPKGDGFRHPSCSAFWQHQRPASASFGLSPLQLARYIRRYSLRLTTQHTTQPDQGKQREAQAAKKGLPRIYPTLFLNFSKFENAHVRMVSENSSLISTNQHPRDEVYRPCQSFVCAALSPTAAHLASQGGGHYKTSFALVLF